MENTLENKAKFFAQYWGQKIFNGKHNVTIKRVLSKYDYLELKPLSSITDEDAIEVQKILRLEDTEAGYNTGYVQIKAHLKESIEEIFLIDFYGHSFEVFDYLRSKGYALPFHDLAVCDLVSYEWIKLKQD